MRKKWSREAFEKKFGSVEWSQNKNTPEAKEYERMSSQYSTYMEIQNGIPVLRFSCFDPWKDWMGAAFSTRLGGVSEGYLSSMNFGWKQGDDLENVKENYRLFAGAIGVSADDYVFSDQETSGNRWSYYGRRKCCSCNILCRLCSIIHCGSEAPHCSRVSFRLAGNSWSDWPQNNRNDGSAIWFRSEGYGLCHLTIDLSTML